MTIDQDFQGSPSNYRLCVGAIVIIQDIPHYHSMTVIYKPEETAYVTMVTSDSYVVGALVLGHSLIANGQMTPGRQLICMTTDAISRSSLTALQSIFKTVPVPTLDTHDSVRLALLGRPDLGQSLTKVAVWALSGVSKAVFLDADMLVLGPIDDLFDRPEFSAAADVGWPDCFNSGLFVCEPNLKTLESLLEYARMFGSFDGMFPARTFTLA